MLTFLGRGLVKVLPYKLWMEFRKFSLSLHAGIQRRKTCSTEKMECMKDVLLYNIFWHPTSVASKIGQFLLTIEEKTSRLVFDLQMKIRSLKTCLKEVMKTFFGLAYHVDVPSKVFVQHMVFDLQMKMLFQKTCLPEKTDLFFFCDFS